LFVPMPIEAPLVSIIVPAFNASAHLRQSLDSILNQSYKPIDVLVMDDASTDRTADIAQSYGPPIRYYRQPPNRGIYGNVNDAILKVSGKYVAVYHADDIYDPAIVEREVGFLERYPEAGVVFSSMTMVDADGRIEGQLTLPTPICGSRPVAFHVVLDTLL